jgi:phosphatidylcholine synthase
MYKKGLSAAIHLLTASGIVLGFWAMILILENEAANALRVLAAAVIIDLIDGTFARRADVQKHVPSIDGALIDNLVDYTTWVFIPMFWAWSFLDISFLICSIVLLTSLFGFSHIQAKTSDNYFRGFPSYWNFLVFYFFLFDFDPLISSFILVFCAILVFMPVKFIYPSRTKSWQRTTLLLALPFFIMILTMLYLFEDTPLWLAVSSLFYPVYYVILSFVLTHGK